MTAATLSERVRRYNNLQLALGVALTAAAAASWIVSGWLFRWAFFLLFRAWLDEAWIIGRYVSWLFLAALVFEGVRYWWLHPELQRWPRRLNRHGPPGDEVASEENTWLDLSLADILASAAQLLLLAPRATVHAMASLGAEIRAEAPTIAQAAAILSSLEIHSTWMPVSAFPGGAEALALLDRLGLIWHDERRGEHQIRLPPARHRD
jgi:hypothetical protein